MSKMRKPSHVFLLLNTEELSTSQVNKIMPLYETGSNIKCRLEMRISLLNVDWK